MKNLIFTLFCLLGISVSFSQTEISGTVKDNGGLPIPGANIIIKGTTSGTISDFDGNFAFTTSVSGKKILQIAYLGFANQEETVLLDGAPIILQIVLQEGGNALDKVVLTASSTFRSQKEAPLSISSKGIQEITRLSANSQVDILSVVPGITAEGGGDGEFFFGRPILPRRVFLTATFSF